jgi:hypothetical protein
LAHCACAIVNPDVNGEVNNEPRMAYDLSHGDPPPKTMSEHPINQMTLKEQNRVFGNSHGQD